MVVLFLRLYRRYSVLREGLQAGTGNQFNRLTSRKSTVEPDSRSRSSG